MSGDCFVVRFGSAIAGIGQAVFEDGAIADNVVGGDDGSGLRQLQCQFEIFDVAGLIGVDKDEIERRFRGGDHDPERRGRISDSDFNYVLKAGGREVLSGDLGVMRAVFKGDQAALGRQRASQPRGAVAAEGTNLEDAARPGDSCEKLEELALIRGDVNGRESGSPGVGNVGGEGRIRGNEESFDIVVDPLHEVFVERFHETISLRHAGRGINKSMPAFTRRMFGGLMAALGVQPRRSDAAGSKIDEALRTGIARRKIPAVAAMAANAKETIYSGGFGKRDGSSGINVTPDSIFSIASMTKPIAATAALQLVERGKVGLDEPASKYLPELGKARVLHGFDTAGKPVLRGPVKPITLRHLLTHTSGFAYDFFSAEMKEYDKKTGSEFVPGSDVLNPLMFEPGARWHYGYSMDWAGRLVEAVSGQTLEAYMQSNILGPLGMKDTSYIMTAQKYERVVSSYQKLPNGTMKENPRKVPRAPKAYSGGGGLYSTPGDYVRFMQMILNAGKAGQDRVLKAETVEMMAANQIGDLGAGRLKSTDPDISADLDFDPGVVDKWGLGFLINTKARDQGRSAGSLAWAGIFNTFFWIDLKRGICATVMMQYLPFADPEAVGLLGDLERSVY